MATTAPVNEKRRRLVDSYRAKLDRTDSMEAVIDIDASSDITEPIYDEVPLEPEFVSHVHVQSSFLPVHCDEGYAGSQTIAFENKAYNHDLDEISVVDELEKEVYVQDDLPRVELELPDLPEDELAGLKKYLAEPRQVKIGPNSNGNNIMSSQAYIMVTI